MSEEQVQESVQENQDIKVENKPENADSSLLQEVMAKKATIKELQDKLGEYETVQEKTRQKQLAEDGKKDELIAELNTKVEKLEGEYTRLSKYEDDEKTKLIASIAADENEAEQLNNESLATLRLLNNKIAAKPSEAPPARGSVGNQPPPENWANMSKGDKSKNWGDILKHYTRNK